MRRPEFLAARSVIPLVIAEGELYLPGSLAMRVRARPTTWGVAMEVPLMVFVPLLPGVHHALVMSTPGAKTSRADFVLISRGYQDARR